MAENCKVYNLESFTDEERERVEKLIKEIEKEKKPKKWWIMRSPITVIHADPKLNYYIDVQGDSYPRNRPPLKSDFDSKEEAEKWLDEYIDESFMFDSARDILSDLILGIDLLRDKLGKHESITEYEWEDCFKKYNESRKDGCLFEVTKRN